MCSCLLSTGDEDPTCGPPLLALLASGTETLHFGCRAPKVEWQVLCEESCHWCLPARPYPISVPHGLSQRDSAASFGDSQLPTVLWSNHNSTPLPTPFPQISSHFMR